MNDGVVKIEANKVFCWKPGQCLRSHCRVFITLPAAVLHEGEPLGDVLKISDEDAQIAFKQAPDQTSGYTCIIVELKSGHSMCIKRGTEALIHGHEGQVIEFDNVKTTE